MAAARWNSFGSPHELAAALAGRIAATLSEAIRLRGRATLAVSGGRTPVRLFEALSGQQIDWSSVTVTLVDERYVPQSDPRSNAGLVRDRLLVGEAAKAAFVPLYRPAETIGQAASLAELAIAGLPRPFDAVVLGMGADGHAASFFPDAPNLAELIANRDGRAVLPVVAASAGEPRLTLSLQLLCAARFLALHIEGDEKKSVLEAALDKGDRPVSAFFQHAGNGVEIFWAP